MYGQHRGSQYLSTLLFRFHLPTGNVEVVDAGSPRVWRVREGAVEPIELEAQMPLGMFEDTDYVPQHFRVEPGDRLLFISDGVYDALSPGVRSTASALWPRRSTARVSCPPRRCPE